ncbi:MAG: cytochrome c [Rhodospirillales bacterium]
MAVMRLAGLLLAGGLVLSGLSLGVASGHEESDAAEGSRALSEADPPPLDMQQVEAGRKIYQEYCASCHGARGEGQPNWETPNAQGELPAPPHNAEGHTWKHSDAMLYRMVSEGWRDPFNKTRHLTMPAFQDQLSSDEIRDVITYLKTLWTPEQRQFQWEETQVRGGFPAPSAASTSQPDGARKQNAD